MPEVLVIGAAGKTGRAVTRALASRGVRVRAAVRPGSTSPVYAGPLARAVPLDLETGAGLAEAMAGVDGVHHLAPNVHPGEVAMARRVADAAVAQGVSRFVFHSVLHPEDASMPHHLRKAEAEKVVRERIASATILRPAAYLQNLEGGVRAGLLEVPYSLDSRFTNVDLDDVAEVAAHAFIQDGYEGATLDLAGPETMTMREMAAVATEALGHPVEARELPLDAWLAGAGSGLPEQARNDLAAMFRSYDRGGLVGDCTTLRSLLGRAPRTWRELLAS
ncbi:NmrA family NAD(P)-binding protein [Knoellia subterranea]|uniref:NmrA-like domain-containing protein n=1 Tax=Knoellia subterranea KCTC 19937 TaxID=1385521 RepID=A0A0A0JL81_9MICO|nr:NAD(P)H-binding protein [Knoellia subterranea]KGN36391.1 hypothetical protein N803_05465 [Knoellia subterranea KCTC 19937]